MEIKTQYDIDEMIWHWVWQREKWFNAGNITAIHLDKKGLRYDVDCVRYKPEDVRNYKPNVQPELAPIENPKKGKIKDDNLCDSIQGQKAS